MNEHVLPADVDTECHLRLERRYVSEILLRPDTDEDAPGFDRTLCRRNDPLQRDFVADEILIRVVATWFRKLRHQPPELRICELSRKRARLKERGCRHVHG